MDRPKDRQEIVYLMPLKVRRLGPLGIHSFAPEGLYTVTLTNQAGAIFSSEGLGESFAISGTELFAYAKAGAFRKPDGSRWP